MKKTHSVKIASSLSVVLVCLACRGYSQSLQSRIDGLVDEYVVGQQFMGSVLVAERGQVVFSKGYGLANVEKNIPNTPETRFMIGSITKQFTAMLVTQLVEQGKLKLEDTISDFIPAFPREIGDKITVEMLLCHSSGLILPEGGVAQGISEAIVRGGTAFRIGEGLRILKWGIFHPRPHHRKGDRQKL
jgi:CubicO group peptidase (beta-lactamase class C family)